MASAFPKIQLSINSQGDMPEVLSKYYDIPLTDSSNNKHSKKIENIENSVA